MWIISAGNYSVQTDAAKVTESAGVVWSATYLEGPTVLLQDNGLLLLDNGVLLLCKCKIKTNVNDDILYDKRGIEPVSNILAKKHVS